MKKEQDIENALIAKLEDLKYKYRPEIRDKEALEQNFREKFEKLNYVKLTDTEFARLRDSIVTADVYTAAQTLREKGHFEREDGTPLHYTLVNIKDWCKNEFEVINQLRINTDNSHHRYDVVLLINGVPVVQIELKNHQIVTRRAMEQIVKYKADPGNGYGNTLMCFMQLFIVSNEHRTYYFANNRNEHFSFNADERFLPIYEHADENNEKISHLHEFANDFLAKCTLGQMISRYMVLVQSEQKLLMMRPYQIYAVKAIVDCIHQNRGNGYIWHTTGSGKTLTSFKASTLLKDNPDIEKCLFVVDRKDLDRQTREEFNKFQDGCVEENTNTETLVRRMLSEDYADKVIVTTIQKLGLALDENSKRNQSKLKEGKQTFKERLEPLRDKRVAFIFDECHRSQFGDNHKAIKNFFPESQLFGFTGTPIFDENSTYTQIDGTVGSFKTTEDIFEKELHAYTITNAIADRNVLSFHIDYFTEGKSTEEQSREGSKGKKTAKKKGKKANPPVDAVVSEILLKHHASTSDRRFNAVLATGSINSAIEYYECFKRMQTENQDVVVDYKPLNIACVFSPPAQPPKEKGGEATGNVDKNVKDIKQLQDDLPQEKADNQIEPEKKKAALKAILVDYNTQYGTNHSINEFDLYYQDVQQRIKDQKYSNADYPHKNKIDIVIVVDMLLTGFDSKYLNTLYVDKNLKYHGLIQAFSRTNRVLNDSKPWGNILDFRGQEDEVNKAISRFSGHDPEKQDKEIWLVDPAPVAVEKYKSAVEKLETFMQDKGLACTPSDVANLKGDSAKAEFINTFKEVQKLKTQIDQYTELDADQLKTVEKTLPIDTLRGFKGQYLETAQELKRKQDQNNEENSSTDDEVQQLDFEFVLFASAVIDYDYIIGLIARSTQEAEKGSSKQKMTRKELVNLISANSNLMDERDDIIDYIDSLTAGEALDEKQIREGYQQFKAQKSVNELNDMAIKHELEPQSLHTFVDTIMNRMIFDGEQLTDLLEPLELSWRERGTKERDLMTDLIPHLHKLAQGREISGLAAYE